MNQNEPDDGINSPHNACCYRDTCRKQQDEIESLKKLVQLQYEDAIVQGHEIEALKEALEMISTGEISGEPTNYKDTVYVIRKIAEEALLIKEK